MQGTLQHRTDIDGLRAFAVISVLLFHANLLPGGFIGVDIFFVISGYLMASIIAQSQAAGRFSVLEFYYKRARRILPALFCVSIITALAGCLLLLPSDVKELGESLIAVSLLHSNYFFKDIALDYFDAGTVLSKPLLHTWTLGVEAQFYLLFPLLVVIATRLKWNAVIFMAALTGLSLLYSQYLVSTNPQTAFYVFPSRFWELAFGATVCFIGLQQRIPASLALLGALILAAVCVTYNDALPFPGLYALPPVIGTALILFSFGKSASVSPWAAKLLASSPVSGLAKISYSLYLWHWPLFAFARYRLGEDLPLWLTLFLLISAVLLSILTYLYIEKPFLAAKPSQPLRVRLASPVIAILLLCTVGILVKNRAPDLVEGFLPANVISLANGKNDRITADCTPWEPKMENVCDWGNSKPDHILIGNSFARMWIPAISAEAEADNDSGIAAVRSGCNPLIDKNSVLHTEKDRECVVFNDKVTDFIKQNKNLRKVIISADWAPYDNFERDLEGLISDYQAMGRKVYVLLTPPRPGYLVPHTLATAELRNIDQPAPLLLKEHMQNTEKTRNVVTRLQKKLKFSVIDPAPALCDDTVCPVTKNDKPLYSDEAHLTVFGALYAKDVLDFVF